MRGFRGLPWLSALLITGNVFLRTVSAVPTDLVARGTFEDLRAQVDDMVNILSEVEGSMIDKAIAAKDLNDELKRTIEEKRKKPFLTSKTLKILFVEFQGSQGDVGKDEAYLKAIQLNAVRRLEWFVNLFTNQHPYELRFVVDCRAKDYLSDETKNNFKRDIAKCGTDQDGFKKNVHDVLSGFKPHVIIRGHAVERLYAEKPKEPEQPPTDPPVDPPQGPPEDTDNPMDLDPNLFPGGQPQDPSDFDPNDDQPPPFVMRAMPRHAVQKRADNDNSDQGDESDRDEEGSEVSDSSSFELNEQADVLPPVHITDFSEAPETADEGTPFMNDFKKPIDERVTDDTLVVIDLKSYYKLPWWIKRPSEYMLTPKRVTLVGQTPDWYEGFSLEDSRQVLIGRAPSPDRKPIPKELDDWINKQKNVMYIGQGGNLRSSEETLEGVTPVIKALTEDVLKDGKYGDW
ncbi:hypothetical protein P154DRAFT_323026 [Amniculicola lignicola CBS 123094]|uniref:Uncharacterized protein n=1 Tax=Amniculicola lignicola CBS 123094 TaxID=1392246 RepID=A0A6A5W890_9PLEO|nr:hypothetical protein P154DRAFT_323026 [Amniculicola lignicola CBS 123094]